MDAEEERLQAEVEGFIAGHPTYSYRRVQPELEVRTGEVVNHKRLRRQLNVWNLPLTREGYRPEPNGVRQIRDCMSGGLNLVEDWQPEPDPRVGTFGVAVSAGEVLERRLAAGRGGGPQGRTRAAPATTA